MKEQILKLRGDGKSYREIQKIVGCSRGTIAFHCSAIQKDKYYQRKRKNVSAKRIKLKLDAGGKCSICGYNRCLGALEFHHPNDDKHENVGVLLNTHGYEAAVKEAKKCKLLCANCHREQHFDSFGNEVL